MECVNCECTVKTMDGLESSIRALLQRGKLVNRMMNDEKAISEARRAEEVQELKKQLPKAAKPATTQATYDVFTNRPVNCSGTVKPTANSDMMHYCEVDFKVPSLPTDVSETTLSTYTNAVVSIPRKTSSVVSRTETTTTELTTETVSTCKTSKSDRGLEIDHLWFVDNDGGGKEPLPMKIYVKQRKGASFDVILVLLDEKKEKVMDISMTVENGKVGNVQVCGNEAKLND